ncbi:MAG: S1 RNA-binding domain-containing protein, partial [Betaproteobacteria bacterium AqS2]|nr:S1 RNA-binding domain-containing protein [Betaproteobacteria bacterium AqS2]
STARATVVDIQEHGAFAELDDGCVGLLPASELDWLDRGADPFEHLEAGQEIEVRILRLCKYKGQAILGLKHCMPNPWEEEIAGLDFANLPFKEGDVLTGTVGAVNDYPKQEARIRIGEGVHGTLRRDDYSWHRFGHLSQTIREGEELQVKVLEVDAAKRLIRLGVKQLTEDTWDELANACPAGTKVFAKVASVKEGYAFVEIRKGVDGLLRSSELDYMSGGVAPAELLEPGQHIEVMVLEMNKDTRSIMLGLKQCQPNGSWDEIKEAFENQSMVEGVVKKRVKGGYVVEVGAMRALLPNSLVDVFPPKSDTNLVGRREKFYVKRINAVRRSAILNRQLVRERELAGDLANLPFKEGDVLAGTVVAVKDHSDQKAYVRIAEGVHGILHRKDFSWHRIGQMSESLSVGEELQVKVLDIDAEGQSIRLGVKQMSSDPWEDIDKTYPVGAKIFAKVVSLKEYGAFVEIEEGIEGLVHVSEMDWLQRNVDPAKHLEPGQRVEVMMLKMDKAARRISLGLKQCRPNPWEEFSASFKKGSRLQGKVVGVQNNLGLFVELPGGVHGLAHLSNLSYGDPKGRKALGNYEVGDEIEVMVLEVDVAKQRIALGIKQLGEDPLDAYRSKYEKREPVTGTVKKITESRAFITLSDEVEAVLPIKEVSKRRIDKISDVIEEGEELQFAVTGFDKRGQITVSLRALDRLAEREEMKRLKAAARAELEAKSASAGAFSSVLLDAIKESRQDSVDDAEREEEVGMEAVKAG